MVRDRGRIRSFKFNDNGRGVKRITVEKSVNKFAVVLKICSRSTGKKKSQNEQRSPPNQIRNSINARQGTPNVVIWILEKCRVFPSNNFRANFTKTGPF